MDPRVADPGDWREPRYDLAASLGARLATSAGVLRRTVRRLPGTAAHGVGPSEDRSRRKGASQQDAHCSSATGGDERGRREDWLDCFADDAIRRIRSAAVTGVRHRILRPTHRVTCRSRRLVVVGTRYLPSSRGHGHETACAARIVDHIVLTDTAGSSPAGVFDYASGPPATEAQPSFEIEPLTSA